MAFRAEKDLLVWLINFNNVTACDLGGGATHVLYKGVLQRRPSVPCRRHTVR